MIRHLLAAFLVTLGPMAPLALAAQDGSGPIPERRLVVVPDADFYGGDLQAIYNSSYVGCQRACLIDPRCGAFTFNTRSNACFPKTGASDPRPFPGALSGRVIETAPDALARAATRRADLGFLSPGDLAQARAQAEGMADRHITGAATEDELRARASAARAAGDRAGALAALGAALNLTDAAQDWLDYARLIDAQSAEDGFRRGENRAQGLSAAINAYLRSETPLQQADALVVMADMLEPEGRGRQALSALRLAQEILPREALAPRLESMVARYGFRIVETRVESDLARPRICADFSEELAAGTDFAPFVQIATSGLAVEGRGNALCVEGVAHGQGYTATFRAGLPAADGQTLSRSVTLDFYVRDRAPAVRFPGRAYVLPRGADMALPVQTVNTDRLDLALRRISDRNLVQSIRNDWFGRSLDTWQDEEFARNVAEEVWTGTAEVGRELNRDITTRLPLGEAAGPLEPGLYVLKASVPGQNPWDSMPAMQWFVVSDLGLTTLSGTDGLHVFVRSLGSAEAMADVTLRLVSRSNRVLGEAVTDAAGYAVFPPGLARGTGGAEAALVVAEDGADDMAFLSLTDPELDLSDRGVEGREPAPPVDVFLTTERGAYRAGEVVHATALARDGQARAIPGLPLTARMIRPDGMEYSRALSSADVAGGHVFALPIDARAPRGTWRLEVLADPDAPPLRSAALLVEDFLPERIDFDLTLPDGPLRLSDAPEITLSARYLFGAPGADLEVEGEVALRAAEDLPGFAGYRFGRHDAPFSTVFEPLPRGSRTDAQGTARLIATLPQIADPGRPLELVATLRVAEGSGRPVERRATRPVAPSAPVIGLRPAFDDVVAEGDEARFAVLAVGPDLTPVAMQARWTLNRIETRYQWYQMYGDWMWEPFTTRSRVAEGTVALTADGAAEIAAPVDWGQYELVVEGQDGAVTSTTFHAGWYAPADTSATPDMLELSLDRPAYAPGDTARLRIVPRAAGVALVTVMSNRLIDMRAVEVTEGENLINLPVTDDWGTGVYVAASVLRPMDVAAGRNPSRALGLAHAAIDPGDRRLTAAFEVPAEAEPRAPLPVALRVEGMAEGETAFATIAAVDVGILNMTAFAAPDPVGHYFGQRRLGIGIRDLYGRLIDGMTGAMGTVRSGGDAAVLQRQENPPTEDLVAFFAGQLTVDADGYARTAFDLPSFNGTVRLMAVVWSDSAVGQATQDVLVRDPVVVTASLPRFLTPGDDSRLLLEFTHATGPAGQMGLEATADGVTLGALPETVDLAQGGTARLAIPVSADAPGVHRLTVTLTTPDGRRLEKSLTLPVTVPDPELARTTQLTLGPGQAFTFDSNAFAGLLAGTARATLAVGPVARLDVPGLLAMLDTYPYGCSEQIASRALPLLYLSDVARALGMERDATLGVRIDEAIAGVLLNQDSTGAFGLWRAGAGDFWLDAYLTDFLTRAQRAGHAVPETAVRLALSNLRNRVNLTPQDFEDNGAGLAYALYVLAREGAAAIGDLRYFSDVKGDDFTTPLAAGQLGAALAQYGEQARADAMFARAARLLQADDPDPRLWRADYGTPLRDAAGLLTLAVEAGSDALDRDRLADLLADRDATRPLSTQEAAWSLLAAHALLDPVGTPGVTLDGAAMDGPLVGLFEDDATRVIRNEGADPLTLTLTTFGVPSEPEPAGGTGYAITRRHYSMEGQPLALETVSSGTRVVTVLEVTPLEPAEARLMVADPLPAGFEIDNPNILRGGDIRALDWLAALEEVEHAEFRQDRFLVAVDWRAGETFRLAYVMRAVTPGSYNHAAASVEDMYRPERRARTAAGRADVVE